MQGVGEHKDVEAQDKVVPMGEVCVIRGATESCNVVGSQTVLIQKVIRDFLTRHAPNFNFV